MHLSSTGTRPIDHPLRLAGELPEPAVKPRFALSAKGFRPFFLLAALFAAAVVPLWLLVLGGVAAPAAYLDPAGWHAHEMVFGFSVAVISGFLLTAVGNWTQRETLVGTPLLALAGLWILGRAAMLGAGHLPRGLPAVVDLAFLPVLIGVLARPLVAARNRRNFAMLAVLAALFAADVVVHLGALGVVSGELAPRACIVGVDVVVLVILVIAGRVFPMFTRNATGVTTIRSIPWLDAATIAGMAGLTALDAFVPGGSLAGIVSGVVGLLAAARAVHWGARHSLRQPLLWILHLGYAWIPIGLLLRALAAVDPAVPRAFAVHALTVGAIGALTLGMMARVALGHSGRPLLAPKPVAWAFGAVTLAAFARAVLPLLVPAWYFPSLLAGGILWTIAFLIYAVVYAPILAQPRLDGKAG